ncbi:MAG: MBOAT family protein [Duodenibacillus sp.]|nr:MBOAT family protein [Oscillospiraceae bacterium]MCF0253252.1 MBOAT family protein [Duodenibacillus sp.]
MVFSSSSFIFFFLPLFLLFDRVITERFRNYLLIIASLLFYVWGEGYGVILLVALCLANMLLGKAILYAENNGALLLKKVSSHFNVKRLLLVAGILFNLSVLLYYKYLFWILTELSAIPIFDSMPVKAHALPLGISFFTFHAISYLVDVYKGIVKSHSGTDFATYYFMFPHLVAGPIVRFQSIAQDVQQRAYDKNLFCYGIFRFILGVNKKILIANSVAPLADFAFIPAMTPGSLDAWIGAIAYAVQIYFDFSGYSDMAIGLAAMMGIRFDENFQSPYRSHSIKEFWRRWHISLSTWFRDYLFIPLGGSRCSKLLNYRNLLIVFILCGLWHGAQFTFLVWGLFHGALLVLEKTRIGKLLDQLPSWARRCYCMLMVIIGWVFFRAETLTQSLEYLKSMFYFNAASSYFSTGCLINFLALGAGLMISLFGKEYFIYKNKNCEHMPDSVFAINLILFVGSLAILYTNNRNPFIYFNF